jgi:hypothetical protein
VGAVGTASAAGIGYAVADSIKSETWIERSYKGTYRAKNGHEILAHPD